MTINNVITSLVEWEQLNEKLLPFVGFVESLYTIAWSNMLTPPDLTIVLATDDPKYSDFVRVARDDPDMYIHTNYKVILGLGDVYLWCSYNFEAPAKLEGVEFLIPVSTWRDQLASVAVSSYIGLAFVECGIIESDTYINRTYSLVTIPNIPVDVIVIACAIDTVVRLAAKYEDIFSIVKAIGDRG